MLAVLGSTAEATFGTRGILATLCALARSRALDTHTVGLGAAGGTASHRASFDHFIEMYRKNAVCLEERDAAVELSEPRH